MDDAKIEKLKQYCIKTLKLDFSNNTQRQYKSISVCILDSVYSLQAQYESTVVPVIEKYANIFMNGNRFSSGDNLSDFLEHIDECGGTDAFLISILKNNQKQSKRKKIEICYEIAYKLHNWLSINSIEDFKNYNIPELLDIVLRSVKGFGDAGISYLYMLAGDENRCKPDTHIHHCIKDALGKDATNEQCQELLSGVTEKLKSIYPTLTVRKLDYLIWNKYQINSKNR